MREPCVKLSGVKHRSRSQSSDTPGVFIWILDNSKSAYSFYRTRCSLQRYLEAPNDLATVFLFHSVRVGELMALRASRRPADLA
jgi:hypothetical protein